MSTEYKRSLGLLVVALATCTWSYAAPWHENLMSNSELMQASCQQLAIEQGKAMDNAQHATDAANMGSVGAGVLSFLEVMAGTSGANAGNTANLAAKNKQIAEEAQRRASAIGMLRSKKNCS